MVVDMKVTPQTVLLQATVKLREAILQGQYAPGERLVELSLCERIGVSRTTVREALRKLESERLVTNVPNRGLSVTIITPAEADQIYHVRKLLEGEAAALFAEQATPDEIDALKGALRSFQDAVTNESAVERVTSTSEFYDILLAGCGNQIIREVLESLVARINVLRAKSMANPGRAKCSVMEMRKIFNAVKKRDAAAARAAAEAHVLAARDAAHARPADYLKKNGNAADAVDAMDTAARAPSVERRTALIDVPGKPILDDAVWAAVEAQLPPAKPRRFLHPGRKPVADREALSGILFVLQNGIQWNELPVEMGFGSGVSCWRRLRDWQQSGVWERIQGILLSKLPSADRVDFSRVVVDPTAVRAVSVSTQSDPTPSAPHDTVSSTRAARRPRSA
jgi:GntR family transcriptional regulator, trigonelline degradation regulator